MNWYEALTFMVIGGIITIVTLAIIGRQMNKPKLKSGKSGINSIVEQDETVVAVLNSNTGDN